MLQAAGGRITLPLVAGSAATFFSFSFLANLNANLNIDETVSLMAHGMRNRMVNRKIM